MKPVYLVYLPSIQIGDFNYFKEVKLLKEFATSNSFLIYDMTDNKNSKNEQKIIETIKKDFKNTVILITRNKNLFTNFNRPIYIIQRSQNQFLNYLENESYKLDFKFQEVINSIKCKRLHIIRGVIHDIFDIYDNVFEINFTALIKNTSYCVNSKNELLELIDEDLNLLEFKDILTSRISIILYRLLFFDLDAKVTSIGNFFRNELSIKSKSFSFKSLNNNHEGFYFTDLMTKPFRGYKIPSLKQQKGDPSYILFSEKIKIAKKLLKSKVKINIVAEALDVDEDTLNHYIYS